MIPTALLMPVFLLREVLKEDESGSLKATVEELLFQSKRKRCPTNTVSFFLYKQYICCICYKHTCVVLHDRVIESHGQVRLGMVRTFL